VQKTQNIQDTLLNQIRREKQIVTFFLMNGFQLKGIVRSFDSFVVILDTDGRQQMIYKHAISTIVPANTVDLRDLRSADDKEHT
jgi:host factor-I protein